MRRKRTTFLDRRGVTVCNILPPIAGLAALSAAGTTGGAGLAAGGAAAGGSGMAGALLGGAGIAAGGSLLGGLIASKSGKNPKKISTFSRRQKEIDQLIFDLLMGVQRGGDGKEIGRSPWIFEMMKRKKPLQKVAPFTANQKGVMNAAAGQLGRVTNPRRPDQAMLSQLGQGKTPYDKDFQSRVQPSMYYAVAGGKFSKHDSAVVGEAGWEIVTALPGGGFEVTPNPKTVSSQKNMDAALAKSKKVQKETGLPGLVAGGAVDPMRKFGSHYLPANMPGWTGATSLYNTDNDWASDVQKSGEAYMQTGYDDYMNTYGGGKNEWKWYEDLQSGKFGEGIGNVDYARANNNPYGPNTPRGKIHTGYGDTMSQWWNQADTLTPTGLPAAGGSEPGINFPGALTTDRPEVTGAMAGIPNDQYSSFSNWWNASPYASSQNELVMRGGAMGFSDPWGVDMANLNQAIPAYQAEYSAPGGPGHVAPEAPAGPDWGALAGQIPADEYTAFNEHLDQYMGGSLAGQGMTWDPTTGAYGLTAEDKYYPGMESAVSSYLTNPLTAGGDDTGGTGATDTETQDAEMFDAILASITSYTSDFDPTSSQANFDASIADPARASFEEYTRPSIRAAHAGDSFFSSGREKAEVGAASQMETAITGARGSYMQTAEEAHKTRGLAATNSLMTLAKLPGEMRAQTASTNHTNALIAGIFHDMEWTNVLADAALTNQTLTSLALMWPFLEAQQNQNQISLDAMMRNAIKDENGFNWDMIFSYMMGTPYQDQGQNAVVA